ncbi:hypothetical protein D3C72_2365610 [compost metagenome]
MTAIISCTVLLLAASLPFGIRTRSLQSPLLLVRPQAILPLLPATRIGKPGMLTPAIVWATAFVLMLIR